MPRSHNLSTFLDLTVEQARAQWRQVMSRADRQRQEPFLPVETILCFGLFRVMNPHRFGGSNIHLVPEVATTLAVTFRRTTGSITNKMLNLEGSRKNAQPIEPLLFVQLSDNSDLFGSLYRMVVSAARDVGLGPDQVPDYLGMLDGADDDLLGQDELGATDVAAIMRGVEHASRTAPPIPPRELERLVLHRARLGQHRFAKDVLSNYRFHCAFCGVSPVSVKRRKLLLASHIKPWAASNDAEKTDVGNGLAACPVHDRAFDGGLLSVSNSLTILVHPELERSLRVDEGMGVFFGPGTLARQLQIPPGATPPSLRYLEYHQREIYAA